MKYTEEVLAPLVVQSKSVAEMLRKLGVRSTGGSHAHISKLLRKYGLDTKHFTGSAWNTGNTGGPSKKHWQAVLVLRNQSHREGALRLRRALIESGVPYQCNACPIKGEWNSKPLRLQVNHRDGNFKDCRKKNLEFLCPNCHSQTSGWCGSLEFSELVSTSIWDREYRKRKRSKKSSNGVLAQPVGGT